MSSIQCFENLREAQREAREEAMSEGGTTYVLRPDGGTDLYHKRDGKVIHTRETGWITRGMHIDPTDTPCIITDCQGFGL